MKNYFRKRHKYRYSSKTVASINLPSSFIVYVCIYVCVNILILQKNQQLSIIDVDIKKKVHLETISTVTMIEGINYYLKCVRLCVCTGKRNKQIYSKNNNNDNNNNNKEIKNIL